MLAVGRYSDIWPKPTMGKKKQPTMCTGAEAATGGREGEQREDGEAVGRRRCWY